VFAQKQFGIVRRGRVNCKVIKRKVIREGKKKNGNHRARTISRAAIVFLTETTSVASDHISILNAKFRF